MYVQRTQVAEATSGTRHVPLVTNHVTDPIVKIASSRDELEQAFRLIHQAYVKAELAEPNAHGMRITKYQLQTSSTIFVAALRGEVISTISLVPDGELGLPIDSAFAEELARLRGSGRRLAEVSCLADRRQQIARRLVVLRELFRWMVQTARVQAIDQLVLAVHPKHTKFYLKYLACELVAGVREFKTVLNQPAVALSLDFQRIDRERPANYDLFFGEPIPSAALERQPMSMDDRAYFAAMLDPALNSLS